MTEQPKGTNAVKKYRHGLFTLGAGMILDNPLVSFLGLYLLYNKAGEGEGAAINPATGERTQLTSWEITYNRSIFVFGVGLLVALLFHSRPVVAAAVVSTTTLIGYLFFRRAGQLEKQVLLLDAVAAFKRFADGQKLGYSVAPVATAQGLCFKVSPLWLPRHFIVSVRPGTGKIGEHDTATDGAYLPVQWFPTARKGKIIQAGGVMVVNGGVELLDEAIRGALSALAVDLVNEPQTA